MASEVLDTLVAANKLFGSVKGQYDVANAMMREQDRLTQDLLHKLELEQLNAVEMTKLVKQLKENRQERRRLKDDCESLLPLVEFCADENNQRTIRNLQKVIGECRKVEEYHTKRHYHPRVKEHT